MIIKETHERDAEKERRTHIPTGRLRRLLVVAIVKGRNLDVKCL